MKVINFKVLDEVNQGFDLVVKRTGMKKSALLALCMQSVSDGSLKVMDGKLVPQVTDSPTPPSIIKDPSPKALPPTTSQEPVFDTLKDAEAYYLAKDNASKPKTRGRPKAPVYHHPNTVGLDAQGDEIDALGIRIKDYNVEMRRLGDLKHWFPEEFQLPHDPVMEIEHGE